MADENQGAQTGEQGQGAPNGSEGTEPEKDWKAEYERLLKHSRTWEDKAKRLADKAKKYDELAAQSMTDAEKAEEAVKRAEDAEAKLAAYEAEAQRAKDAAEVSEKTGVPASLITETDRKAMEKQAEAIKAYASGQPSAQVFKGDGSKPNRKAPDDMHEYVKNLIH